MPYGKSNVAGSNMAPDGHSFTQSQMAPYGSSHPLLYGFSHKANILCIMAEAIKLCLLYGFSHKAKDGSGHLELHGFSHKAKDGCGHIVVATKQGMARAIWLQP